MEFDVIEGGFELRLAHEVLRVEHWGADSVRVRAAIHSIPTTDVGALQERPGTPAPAPARLDDDGVVPPEGLTLCARPISPMPRAA